MDITSSGSSDGNLLGYTVEDGAGSTYSFPNGYTLAAGETVRLHNGDGTNTSTAPGNPTSVTLSILIQRENPGRQAAIRNRRFLIARQT